MARIGVCALTCAIVAATPVPFVAWSTASTTKRTPAVHSRLFDRDGLYSVLRADAASHKSHLHLSETPSIRHVFVFDKFSSDDMNALATSSAPGTMGLMTSFSKTVSGAAAAFSAPRADMWHAEGSVADGAAASLVGAGCNVVKVLPDASGLSKGSISRSQYTEVVAQGSYESLAAVDASNITPAPCTAFIVSLQGAKAKEEVAWITRVSTTASKQGRHHLFALTSESSGKVPASAYNTVEAHTAGNARFLGATSNSTASRSSSNDNLGGINITPEVVQGLVVGFLLLFITIIGLQCTMDIKTPDVMHSFTLPAGKEY